VRTLEALSDSSGKMSKSFSFSPSSIAKSAEHYVDAESTPLGRASTPKVTKRPEPLSPQVLDHMRSFQEDQRRFGTMTEQREVCAASPS